MPLFDFAQFQAMWDGIFPAIANPLASSLDAVAGSVQGP